MTDGGTVYCDTCTKKIKLTAQDIEDYNALPPKEKIKAWESLKRLESAGEIEPIAGKIQKPDEAKNI